MLWPGIRARRAILAISVVLVAATFGMSPSPTPCALRKTSVSNQCFGCVALSVVDTCGACNLGLSVVASQYGHGELFSGTTFGVAAAAMSFATNAIATCFTAYRAWCACSPFCQYDLDFCAEGCIMFMPGYMFAR